MQKLKLNIFIRLSTLFLSAVVCFSLIACSNFNEKDEPEPEQLFDFSGKIVKVENTLPFSNGKGTNSNTDFFQNSSKLYDVMREIDYAEKTGYEIFRLPVVFNTWVDENGIIPDEFFVTLRTIMDIVEADYPNMYVVLDNHTFASGYKAMFPGGTEVDYRNFVINIWNQITVNIGTNYPHLVYELQNEAWFIFTRDYYIITQQTIIENIRSTDNLHYIIIDQSDAYNYDAQYFNKENLANKKLIYSFHFYTPGELTHNSGHFSASEDELGSMLGNINWALNRANLLGLPIFIGEFGALWSESDLASRTLWYRVTAQMFKDGNCSFAQWTMGFAPCGETWRMPYESGFYLPTYLKDFGLHEPVTSSANNIVIFDDFVRNAYATLWWNEATSGDIVIVGDTTDVHNGNYAISAYMAEGQSTCSVRLISANYDFNYLKENGYLFEYWAKAEGDGETVNYEAVMYDISAEQNRFKDVSMIADGEWHKYQISLDTGWNTAPYYLWGNSGITGFRLTKNTIPTTIYFDDIIIVRLG